MPITTQNLERATELSRRIDEMQKELRGILSEDEQPAPSANGRKTAPKRRVASKRGLSSTGKEIVKHLRGKASKGQGLAPAVVAVLKENKKPMNVGAIYDALVASGYKFPPKSKNPKRVLAARIYSLQGVEKVDDGLFAPKK